MEPQIRFLKSADGTRIAYAVLGDGSSIPVISVNSIWWTIDMMMGHPPERARLEGLAESRRVLTFDRRGSGASERAPEQTSFDSHVADLQSVVDQVGADRVHLIGFGDGASIAAAFAAKSPARVARLIFHSPTAKGYPSESIVRLIRENWSWARRLWASAIFPSGPVELQRWTSQVLREAMSPEMAVKAIEMVSSIDIVELLPKVQSPTLIVEFSETRGATSQGREVAALIPGASIVTIPGEYTAMWESPEYTLAVKEFLDSDDGTSLDLPSGTAIILFADIVDSTALTERLGDAAFRDKARDLDAAMRTIIRDHSGTAIEGKLVGDGIMAVFTSARQAIEAALACARAGGELALHLGIHAGDVIREANNVYGGAVNIAARISGLSAPGEVLVSDTVRSLARTSAGVSFMDRGERALKGIQEPVRVWAVGGAD